MFGLGNGSGEAQPQDTKSIWGDMFGLGGLMKVISDPALIAHAHAMMQATIEGANSSRRIEAKLDRLLGALGHEISDIDARYPAQHFPAGLGAPPLLVEHGANGAAGHPAATGAAHDGSQNAAGSAGETGVGPRPRRPHDSPAGG
jgi:hypothetical protein